MSKPAFLRITDTAKKVGVANSTIWLWARQGRFPKPVKIGPRVTGWRTDDIERWLTNPSGWQADGEAAQ